MSRTVMGITLVILVLAAAPTLASQERQTASERPGDPSGGGALTLASSTPMRAPNPDETVVTGKVVMMTPVEVVVATDKGLMRFGITPSTQLSPDVVEGGDATLFYTPSNGTAQASSVQVSSNGTSDITPNAQTSGANPSSVGSTAPASAGSAASPEPAIAEPEKAAEPTQAAGQEDSAGASNVPPATIKQLPKTGSDLPLIGMVGLLALGGAVALRLTVRS